jgi:hypothetical protein
MKVKTLLVASILLGFSVGFILLTLAYYSPRMFFPAPPTPCVDRVGYANPSQFLRVCMAANSDYYLMKAGGLAFWGLATKLTEGMACAAAAFCVVQGLRKRPMRGAWLFGFVWGAWLFGSLVIADVLHERLWTELYPLGLWAKAVLDNMPAGAKESDLGLVAFGTYLFAVGCLFVFQSRKGFREAVKVTVFAYAAPAVMSLEVGLMLFTPAMGLHVTNFAGLSVGGVYVFSNWNVLFISTSLTVLGAILFLRKRWRGATGEKLT